MIWRTLIALLFAATLSGCQAPYKKADEEDKKPLKDQSNDTTYQAFLGRLRIAVAKRDVAMLASMMTPDFGYRWDTPPPGETPFVYWDQNDLWGELNSLLKERFAPKDLYMVAPPQAVSDPEYAGYRVGMRVVGGSWKFAYFVGADDSQ